jgi:tetratricopeptide (TPR) repeat protein
MSLGEEELIKKRRLLDRQAINMAIEGNWIEAVLINSAIIEKFPEDIDALNRLGKAYLETGDFQKAREAYGRAMEIDPYNIIAEKNLHRLSHLKAGSNTSPHKLELQSFIEETGKAGVVNLTHLAASEVLLKFDPGDRVILKTENNNLVIVDDNDEYIGRVDTSTAQRLIRLIKGGNRYSATVTSSAEDNLTVIIRETYQDPSQIGHLSFPAKPLVAVRTGIIQSESEEINSDVESELEEEPELLITDEEEEEESTDGDEELEV